MKRENLDNIPILDLKVTVQNFKKSLNSTRRLTPEPRNRNSNSINFRSSLENQRIFYSNQEISARARFEKSLEARSSIISRERLRPYKKETDLADISDYIHRNNPTDQNALIQASQITASLKDQLREQIHALCRVEKEDSKSSEIKKRQTLVPYVINKQEFKRLPPQIINRAGSSYRNLSERDRFERNSIEINKLRLSLGKEKARDRAICLSFMQKYTHETFDEDQVSSFINFIQRQEPISPNKTMKDFILESNLYIETLKSYTTHQPSSRCYSSSSRIHKDLTRYSSQPRLSSKPSSLRTTQLNAQKLKRYLIFRLGTPWEITHFPYNDTFKRNTLLLENVMLQRLHKKTLSRY